MLKLSNVGVTMDFDHDITCKQCYRFEEKLIENVNILKNKANDLVIFWNKYQIILYENTKFEKVTKTIIPEYPIQCLLLFNNYLVSLDYQCKLYSISLKLKKGNQKCVFHLRDTEVIGIAQNSTDNIISLKLKNDLYFINIHGINQDFYLERRVKLLIKEHFPIQVQQGKCIINCYAIRFDNLKKVQEVFNVDIDSKNNYSLTIISFDRKDLYACLLNANEDNDEITLVKLYSSPAKICNIELLDTDNVQIFVGLTVGTIIELALTDISKKPDVLHLNTALTKFVLYNNNVLYTDSQTMWIAENLSSISKCKQLFIKNVKDFIILDDLVICTTFSKFIYKFSIQNEDSYLNLESEEYYPAENVLNNSECLQRIMEYVEENEQLVKKMNDEEIYLTALALSNRKNLMDEIIKSEVFVYENYLDVMKETLDLLLVEDISNYCSKDAVLFLINMTITAIQHRLNKTLKNIFDNSRVLIMLSTEHKTLKTASVQMTKQNNFKCLVTLQGFIDWSTKIIVNISIVSEIPGIFDNKANVMCVLYNKDIKLSTEQFRKNN